MFARLRRIREGLTRFRERVQEAPVVGRVVEAFIGPVPGSTERTPWWLAQYRKFWVTACATALAYVCQKWNIDGAQFIDSAAEQIVQFITMALIPTTARQTPNTPGA